MMIMSLTVMFSALQMTNVLAKGFCSSGAEVFFFLLGFGAMYSSYIIAILL